MFHDMCFSSCHSLLMRIEFQFNQGGIDHIVDLSHSPYTRDDYFTGMETAKIDPTYFKIKDWKQFWFIENDSVLG